MRPKFDRAWIVVAVGAVATSTLLFLRPGAIDTHIPADAASTSPIARVADVAPLDFGPTPSPREFRDRRNAFSFVDPPIVFEKRAPQLATVIASTAPPVVIATEPAPVVPTPPPFPYRCIGRFGPDANPFATFTGNETLINARAGEVIDGAFVVRKIRADGVEIGFVAFPDAEVKRIAFGE